MVTRYITVEAEVDLSEFDTDDLIHELKDRGEEYGVPGVSGEDMRLLLEQIWHRRRCGLDYQSNLDQLIRGVLGKVV